MVNEQITATREIVLETILGFTGEFTVTDLLYRLQQEHGVEGRSIPLKILDELYESGIVGYSWMDDGRWAFKIKK